MRFYLTGIISSALLLMGCSGGKEAATQAENFLNAYLTADYQQAGALCTEEVNTYLKEALKEFLELPEETRERVREFSSKLKPEITGCEKMEDGTLKIYYSILSAPNPESGQETKAEPRLSGRSLVMTREKEGWRVSEICK